LGAILVDGLEVPGRAGAGDALVLRAPMLPEWRVLRQPTDAWRLAVPRGPVLATPAGLLASALVHLSLLADRGVLAIVGSIGPISGRISRRHGTPRLPVLQAPISACPIGASGRLAVR